MIRQERRFSLVDREECCKFLFMKLSKDGAKWQTHISYTELRLKLNNDTVVSLRDI